MTNFYLKHSTSDEMSEFTTINFGAMMQIKITHFVRWGSWSHAHAGLPCVALTTRQRSPRSWARAHAGLPARGRRCWPTATRWQPDIKVVEIDQAREIWRMLVAQGFAREIGTEVGNRIQACQLRSQS